MTPYIAYYRVSTDGQGASGYGLEAQRAAVAEYVKTNGGQLTGEFTEVESGKRHDNRPQLDRALTAARKSKATLVIAKLDRLARNVAFIAGLMERKVEFVCTDMPSATPFMLHVYAAVAEEERRMIAQRTRAGLAAAKARGVVLGNAAQAAANHDEAMERAWFLREIFEAMATNSARDLAHQLNTMEVATPTGAPWSAKTVIRVRERLANG